jgi:hypothetical protein
VLIGNLLPTHKVSVEVVVGSVTINKETDVQPLMAPASFVSVNIILGLVEFENGLVEFEERLAEPVGVAVAAVPADVVACRTATVLRGKGFAGTALTKPVRKSKATAVRLLVAAIWK